MKNQKKKKNTPKYVFCVYELNAQQTGDGKEAQTSQSTVQPRYVKYNEWKFRVPVTNTFS